MRNIPGIKFYRNAEGGASGGEGGGEGGEGGGDGGTQKVTVGQAAESSQQSSSASASVPSIGAQGANKEESGNFRESLGDLAEDPTIKDVTDAKTLAQRLIDTKKLVGQKLGIPDDKSSPEAKAEFYKALGVPDNGDGYGLEKVEVPEELKAQFDPEEAKSWGEIFKANNIPVQAAQALQKAMMDKVKDIASEFKVDEEKSDKQFDELATKAFGDKKESALQNARLLLEKHVSKDTAETMKNASNAQLIAFAEFASNFSKEMTGEDQVLKGEQSGGGQNEGEMRQEMRTIMASPEFNSPFSPKGREAHEEAKRKVNELATKIASIKK